MGCPGVPLNRVFANTRFLIVASLGFQVVALTAVMGLGTWGIHQMSRLEDLEFYEGFSTIEAAHKLRGLAQQEIILTRGRLLANPTEPARDRNAREAILARAYADTLAQVVEDGTPGDEALLNEIRIVGAAYWQYSDRVGMILAAGDRDAALRLHRTEGLALNSRWLPLLDDLIARRGEQIAQHHEEVNATENLIKSAMLLAALLTIPVALLLALVTVRRVLTPLESLEQAANAMGAGRLEARVAISRDDEFGHLAQAFNTMARRVEESVETLRAANEELVHLDRHKDEFLSIVSHELRTPLNAMKGFATLMANGLTGPISEQQRQYTANIVQSADRMGRLVNDLLDLASLRLDKLKLEREPTDYRLLVEDVVGAMAPLAAEKDLSLATEIDPEIDAGTELVVDYDRVAQVLTNLVANAVKFTPRGGRVTIQVARSAEGVLTEVHDSGIGIADGDLPKLFQPFSQADMGPARRAGGTGLGLSISKALIEAHGGEIGVRSVTGLGSTFWYTLPHT